MPIYKVPLLLAYPTQMKFLNNYASKIGGKLSVDVPEFLGFVKEINVAGVTQSYGLSMPEAEDAQPPGGLAVVPGFVQLQTEDNLNSKKQAVIGIYSWAQQLDQALYTTINLVQVPQEDPEEEQETIIALLSKV